MQILLTLLKSSMKRCHSLALSEGNSSIQSILRLQRLCMKILALATTGPNSPNGSDTPNVLVSIDSRTHSLRGCLKPVPMTTTPLVQFHSSPFQNAGKLVFQGLGFH
ncbi:hypothetical protein TNCV_4196651 [Trichonephila clavipes]|nr:hypothetical protein TNCV_4196651 [Trichonephila clavipes]